MNENITNELLTQEDRDAIKFLSIKSKFDEGKLAKNMINQQSKSMLESDEETDIIDEKLRSLTKEEIEVLTEDEIDAIFMGDDHEIKLNNRDQDRDTELKRDFLLFRKSAIDTFDYIDAETERLNAELEQDREEFDRISETFDTFTDVMVNRLKTIKETSTDEENIKRIDNILEQVENGFTLNNIKKYMSNQVKRRNIYSVYGVESKTQKMLNKYNKILRTLGINETIQSYGNIEDIFLGKGYTSRPNIFAVIFMTYISEMRFDEINMSNDGVFISQFMTNLKDLFYGKMTGERKETFVNNIKEIVDMIEK